MPPRLALLTPFAAPSVRGNAITTERIARGLGERGVTLRVWDLSAADARAVEDEIEAYRPALVHAFHAYRTGPLALRVARRLEVPLVVTLTGTDANHDLLDPERAPAVRHVLEGAGAVVAFDASVLDRVAGVLPDVRPRMHVVPQSARLEPTDVDAEAEWGIPEDAIVFLFPGGIRPVKGPRRPLRPLGRLAADEPRLRLLYAGPVLDAEEGRALAEALESRPWARHLGPVPHARMRALLARADVVLNCSLSEGGMANAVLEALSLGRAVLASDIPGNRSLVADGVTGFLFRDETELETRARALTRDPLLRARLGAAGRAVVQRSYPPEREIDGYLAVYAALTVALSR